MKTEQFVMAYSVEQDRLRAMLPDGFKSLRPVLRINAEIYDEKKAYLELNTAVEGKGKRGWLNIGNWNSEKDGLKFKKEGKKTTFIFPFLEISFEGVGIVGGCPAENDNDGCFFLENNEKFRKSEKITSNKEFCDCEFKWSFSENDAHGKSIGKTLPAYFTEPVKEYEKQTLSAENAAKIECIQVLGTYRVEFER